MVSADPTTRRRRPPRLRWVLLLLVIASLATRTSAVTTSKKKLAKFYQWLDDRKALGTGNIRIGRVPTRDKRGVMTNRDYDAGAAMFVLPLSVGINLGEVDWPRPVSGLPTKHAGYITMVKTLRSKRHRAYTVLLPKLTDCTLPDCWSDGELAELREPELIAVVREKHRQLRVLFQSLKRKYSTLTFAELMRAHFLMQTRIFGISLSKGSQGKEIGFQIPMIDFLNTDDEPNARLVLGDDDPTTGLPSNIFIVAGERPIAAGDEITIDYGGSLKPIKRLLNFGFLPRIGEEWRGDEEQSGGDGGGPLYCIDSVPLADVAEEHVDALQQRLRQYRTREVEIDASAAAAAAPILLPSTVNRRRLELATEYRERCALGIEWALRRIKESGFDQTRIDSWW